MTDRLQYGTTAKVFHWLIVAMEWALLAMIGFHVAAAMVHIFIYRDRVMQRMLPG